MEVGTIRAYVLTIAFLFGRYLMSADLSGMVVAARTD